METMEWRREKVANAALIRRMAAVPKPVEELLHPTMARIYKAQADLLLVPVTFLMAFHAALAACPLTNVSACAWRAYGKGMILVINFTAFLVTPSGIGKSNVVTWMTDNVLEPFMSSLNRATMVTNYTLEALKSMISAHVRAPPPCTHARTHEHARMHNMHKV